MFDALKASPTHTIGAVFEWEDRGFFGPKKKQYALTITQLTAQEAKQRYNVDRQQSEYLVIGFFGELPRSKLSLFDVVDDDSRQGHSMVFMWAEGFLRTLDSLEAGSGSDWEPV